MQIQFAKRRERRHVPLAQLHTNRRFFLSRDRVNARQSKQKCVYFQTRLLSESKSERKFFEAIRRSETFLRDLVSALLVPRCFTTPGCLLQTRCLIFDPHVWSQNTFKVSLASRVQVYCFEWQAATREITRRCSINKMNSPVTRSRTWRLSIKRKS